MGELGERAREEWGCGIELAAGHGRRSGWQGEMDGERDGWRGRKWKLGKEEEKGAAMWVKVSRSQRQGGFPTCGSRGYLVIDFD